MAKSFTELVKSRRDKGGSIAGSISYSIKERLKEKFDPRQMLNQKGLLTALFPGLKAYQAGASGLSGTTGATGASGLSGSSGATGASGLSGSSGATGASGLSGSSGATGASGLSGSSGATGASGLAGTTGATGASGLSGATGASGLAGTTGATGASGLSGATGASGVTGNIGATGASGLAGATGASKTGLQLNSPNMVSESLVSLEPILESISINTKLSAKNSMVLPMMHRDINVIRQNMAKLVKLEGGTPASRADKFFMKSRDLQAAYDVQSKTEKSIKPTPKEDEDKSFFQILLGGILKGLTALGGIITSAFGSIAETLKKIVNIKELAKAVLLKESFKTMLAAMLGAVVRPLLPILIVAAIAEYFRFNSITESLNKNQQATNARQIPGLGAPNEKGERKAESGNVQNKELSTNFMVGKYNKDTVQGIVEGDYQVVEVFLPGTNQREYLPLLTDEAQDLKDNYNNLYVALNQLDKLSKEKGGTSHEKIAQFVALRDKSQKNIYEMWQKNLKGRFNQPSETLIEHIENKLKYPNLSHYEGKIKAMQDSMTKALTGSEPKNAIDVGSNSPDPEAMVTVTSISSPQIEPVIKDSGNAIDVGSKQIKAQARPNTDNSPEVNVNNNNNNVNKKSQVQTIPSAYDPTISTKLAK